MSGPQIRHGTELRIFNQHLVKLKKVSAKVDNKAPRLPVSVYIKESSFFADISRLRKVEQQNRNLLKNINIIYRTKGKVDCQLQKYNRKKTIYHHEQALEKQRKQNTDFLQKLDLKLVKSKYNQEDMLKDWRKALKNMKFSARYPEFYNKKQVRTWSLCPKNIFSDPKTHQLCYMDFMIGDLSQKFRVDIEVYSDIVPGSAANFTGLCSEYSGLSYKDSVLHRIVPGLFCLGGDIVNHSGTGGLSIYGSSFPDENFTLQHNGPGVVAMYSRQPDQNNSQFLITFRRLSTLNGKYVVIGRVTRGFQALGLIESCGTRGGKPVDVVRIASCGVYQ